MGKLAMKLKIIISYVKVKKKKKFHVGKDIYNAPRCKLVLNKNDLKKK